MLNKNQNKTDFGILYSPILALSFYLLRHVDGGTKEPMRLADHDAFASHWEKILFCYQLKDRKEAHAHFLLIPLQIRLSIAICSALRHRSNEGKERVSIRKNIEIVGSAEGPRSGSLFVQS